MATIHDPIRNHIDVVALQQLSAVSGFDARQKCVGRPGRATEPANALQKPKDFSVGEAESDEHDSSNREKRPHLSLQRRTFEVQLVVVCFRRYKRKCVRKSIDHAMDVPHKP